MNTQTFPSELLDLGERWAKAGGPPVADVLCPATGERGVCYGTGKGGLPLVMVRGPDDEPHPVRHDLAWICDFRSGATRGAALDVVRERHPDAYLMPVWADLACKRRVWVVCRESDAREIADGATEAEALVAALEAATRPGR